MTCEKILEALVLLLAINFLAVAGATGWLVKSGHVDREKLTAVKSILFPPPSTQPAAQGSADATTQPSMRLDQLIARQSNRTANEQVEFIQRNFDTQMTILDRREREIRALEQTLENAKQQAARDRVALKAAELDLKKRQDQATRLASDQGFQDALARYIVMPPKQVKQIFMTLNEQTMTEFLEAMEPRTAAKIIKEFKTDEEVGRIQKVLEKMRQAQASAKE